MSVAFRETIHPVIPHRTAVEYHILQRVDVARREPESPSTDSVFLVHPPLSGLNCYAGNVTHEQPIVIPNDRETIHIYERDHHSRLSPRLLRQREPKWRWGSLDKLTQRAMACLPAPQIYPRVDQKRGGIVLCGCGE